MPQIRHEPLNGGFAYIRAASAIWDAGTPVIFSAYARSYFSTTASHSSKPSVRSSMNDASARPSSSMTFAIAFSSATSVPGRSRIHRSA